MHNKRLLLKTNAVTPKQIEKAKKKIFNIKRTLVAEKRRFGCHDDSRGLRSLPTKYFIQLGDNSGGLTYIRWFDKNFPDDSGFPDFLFEQTIIFLKCSNTKKAEQKAFQTFCSNPYWFSKFFGTPITPIDMWHSSNLISVDYTETLEYSSGQHDLADFNEWLGKHISTDEFSNHCNKYVNIYKRLKTESDKEMRQYLVQQAFQLKQGL